MDKSLSQKFFPRILKAIIKSMIVLILFLVFSQFLAPLQEIFPETQMIIEAFVMVYIVFLVAGELTKGTIYHYCLNIGKAFFFIGYSIYALNSGTITFTIDAVTFSIGLQILLIMIIITGVLDLAKNLLQIINYLADKAETEETTLITLEQEAVAKQS